MSDTPQLDLTSHFTVVDESATSPVIVHAPHGSRFIPPQLLPSYAVSEQELELERDRMTDHFTDTVARETAGASAMINGLSRFVVDVERFPDEREEMLAVGMGAFYTHGSQGQLVRAPEHTTHAALAQFFASYSAAFTQLVTRTLAVHGRAVIIDLHSYPTQPLPYELHSSEPRPQLCIGADSTHTPEWLIEAVRRAFPHLECGVNQSFHGTYVPLEHYEARDTRVSSVMLEVRRDTYMDEHTVAAHPAGLAHLASSLQSLVRELRLTADFDGHASHD
jgi:N-formylglutamate amidohydrolase